MQACVEVCGIGLRGCGFGVWGLRKVQGFRSQAQGGGVLGFGSGCGSLSSYNAGFLSLVFPYACIDLTKVLKGALIEWPAAVAVRMPGNQRNPKPDIPIDP